MQLVEEPVEVEEGGRELVEDEGGAVEVDKGPLESLAQISHTHYIHARSPEPHACPEKTNRVR